jgi:hypothetical protein
MMGLHEVTRPNSQNRTSNDEDNLEDELRCTECEEINWEQMRYGSASERRWFREGMSWVDWETPEIEFDDSESWQCATCGNFAEDEQSEELDNLA